MPEKKYWELGLMRANDEKRVEGQWKRRDEALVQFILGYNHFVRAPGDVVVAPLDDDGVAALVLDGVGDIVELVAHVLNIHLLTGSVGSMDPHHQHIGTWAEQ